MMFFCLLDFFSVVSLYPENTARIPLLDSPGWSIPYFPKKSNNKKSNFSKMKAKFIYFSGPRNKGIILRSEDLRSNLNNNFFLEK